MHILWFVIGRGRLHMKGKFILTSAIHVIHFNYHSQIHFYCFKRFVVESLHNFVSQVYCLVYTVFFVPIPLLIITFCYVKIFTIAKSINRKDKVRIMKEYRAASSCTHHDWLLKNEGQVTCSVCCCRARSREHYPLINSKPTGLS